MAFEWSDFVTILKDTEIEFQHLKKVQLAQAILESGRGKSDLFKLHSNPFGMKYRPEMSGIAIPVSYEASDGADIYCKFETLQDAVDGYWIFIERPVYSGWRTSISSPEEYIEFIAFAGYIGGASAAKQIYVDKVTSLFDEASELLNFSPDPNVIWKKNGVLLEIGHGKLPSRIFDPGAIGVNSKNEYNLNQIATKAAQRVIKKAGVPCDITDAVASLYRLGKRSAGYDVFCSIHHNSASVPAQGAEVLVHDHKADSADLILSKIMSAEIATELGIRDRIARGRNPRQRLGILSGAEDTDVRAAVLAEVYFIHVPVPDVIDWSTRGGQAVGRAIVDWLTTNQG
ncbi:glucosaminidase domain-containing protein [Mastigocoleus sp. MO_188.B34]|uniref:glucosaminidase domain-containing protein n=1 Tax=Mastigocoleus sp. MO_188.B34 TaxID=3036635 RepID=UPI002630B03B|nr:glucosaminidase domain-containing protein [Mastigocoleus sp. MO_188.B34]MDJ0693234.1 N-acetylmuramoyl-L-alanine amidase [Mastigocoleus sp. MO_188.B34]